MPERRRAGRLPVRLSLLTVLVLVLPGARADYYDGLEAFRDGDFERALAEWLPLARGGDAEASYRVGTVLADADDPQLADPAEAAGWFESAAERGHRLAQARLGRMYMTGTGVEHDDARALGWLRGAAMQGVVAAQFDLASMLDAGRGATADPVEAARWLRSAAEGGHVEARFRLGLAYEMGRGVEQNADRALRWYRRAARDGHAEARLRMDALRSGERAIPSGSDEPGTDAGAAVSAVAAPATEAAEIPTSEDATAASAPRETPDEASPTATGDVESIYRRGRSLAFGDGVDADPQAAESAYREAALRGHGLAAYRLGFMHLRGEGPSGRRDPVEAWAWFGLAAERKVGDAARWRDRVAEKLTDDQRDRARERLDELRSAEE